MEYAPDSYSGQVPTESLGYYSLNGGSCRMLVRVNNLPAVPDNSYIVNSIICLCGIAYSSIAMDALRIQAQALQYNSPIYGYWCLSHTWNNCPPLESSVIDYDDISSAPAFYNWDVTGEALKWYNDPTVNYGICLKATKESEMTSASCANAGFCSSNTENDAARPYFIVEYRNCIGLESYYSYQTHGIDRAGTGYVGDYSGQLTLVKDDVVSASTVNPVAISHIYNSGYANIGTSSGIHAISGLYSSMGVGLGWMLNIQQSITLTTSGYLMYVDGDGTAHYFQNYSGSTYKDEDGLGLTITKSGYNYTLRDRKDNISYFTNGMLSYMQDANGNRINIVRDNDDVILYVTRQNSGGSVETIASFSYNAAGNIGTITDNANNVTSFSYDSLDQLTSVTHPDGTTVTYTYDGNYKLLSAKDNESGYSMNYEYNANTGKVSEFYEKVGNTVGASVLSDGFFDGVQTYRYCGPDRILNTGDDIVSHSLMDFWGRTFSSYSTNASETLVYGAGATVYSHNEDTNATNNRALASSSVGVQSTNLLKLPGIEAPTGVIAPWSFSGGGSSAVSTDKAHTGYRYIPGSSTEQRQTYNITYNGFGSMTGVSVGTRNLAAYTYGSANGLLQEMSYGNGASVSYDYDKLERISNVYYNNSASPAASYIYSGNGGLGRVTDNAAGKVTDYSYDSLNRLTSMTERYGTYGVQVYLANYDSSNRVSQTGYKVSPAWNGVFRDNRIYGYTYSSSDGSLSTMALPANGQYAYTYDGLKRLTTRSLSLNGNGFLTKGYTYVPGAGTNSTTMLVGGLTNQKGNTTLNSYTYTYDNVGNITAIGGTTPASYTYDSHGQMLTETVNGVTYTYTYDTYGNIRSVSDGVNTYTYTYGDSNWKDLLTAYCGQSITYDQIGNPTHWYNGNNFTWVNGRRLATITASSGGTVASYAYDVDGLRQTKTVGGVEHRYVWQGNKLVSEYWDGKELEFFYDESGMPYAFSYKSSSSATPVFYYYVTNLQGDVVKILTASGTEVANYSYNAWGKLLSSSGTMASVNPIRYRGYYFDVETGLYYVSSRYYDPEICRFINADDASYLGANSDFASVNLFAYCGNNPVNRSDPDGTDWRTAFALGFTVAMVGLVVLATLPFSGPLLAGIGVSAATVATAASATVAAGLTVEVGSLIQAAISNSTNPSHSGKPTYNDKEKNERIEYEYYGNGNGNVHYELGRNKTNIWRLKDGKESMSQLPRRIEKIIMSNPEMQRAIAKGIDIVSSLAGLK